MTTYASGRHGGAIERRTGSCTFPVESIDKGNSEKSNRKYNVIGSRLFVNGDAVFVPTILLGSTRWSKYMDGEGFLFLETKSDCYSRSLP